MIGIYAEFKKNDHYLLKQFFDLADNNRSKWTLDEDDIIDESQPGKMLNLKHNENLVSDELQEIFKKPLQVIFARLMRWPIEKTISPIDTYSDYIKSECSLVILCVDGYDYEVYCKEENEVHKFFEFFKNDTNVRRLECFFDENEARKKFHFW